MSRSAWVRPDDNHGPPDARIDALGDTLRATYRAIRAKAPGADIVVAGYPLLIMPASGELLVAWPSGIPASAMAFRIRKS